MSDYEKLKDLVENKGYFIHSLHFDSDGSIIITLHASKYNSLSESTVTIKTTDNQTILYANKAFNK